MNKAGIYILLVFLNQYSLSSQGFIIDHNSVKLFDQIPEQYLEAARNTRLMFSDRSVGQNINEALDYFEAESWEKTPSSARRDYIDTLWNTKLFTIADWNAGLVPERIRFNPDPVKYDRSKWIFVYKQGDWSGLTKDFIDSLAPSFLDSTDVLTYQFSYLNVMEGDDISDPQKGFFANTASRYDVYDLEKFLQANADKKFFYWTTSLARGIGTKTSTDFNNAMRDYCRKNNKALFDMSDILSHTDKGIPCFDNRDGIPYKTENHPDDGFDYPAICQDYTTELEGGHLGSVSGGKIIIAKAFWVMMARLAGWDPGLTSSFENDPLKIGIFPNPANDKLNVQLSSNLKLKDLQFQARNPTGSISYTAKWKYSSDETNIEIETSSLQAGIYFLIVHSEGLTVTKKFMILR